MNQSEIKLSKKRYGISRIIKYLQLILIVVLMFVPFLQIVDYDESTQLKATASISPIQFITGNTESELKISSKSNSEAGDFFESMLSSMTKKVNVVHELVGNLDDNFLTALQIAPIFIALFVAFINMISLSSKRAPYITTVFDSLPKPIEFIEKACFGIILSSSFMFFILHSINKSLASAPNVGSSNVSSWKINLFLMIFICVTCIALINGLITHLICKKDIKNIKTNHARFEEIYDKPTFSSDISAILGIFSAEYQPSQNTPKKASHISYSNDYKEAESPKTINFTNEENSIEILKKYKQLLDDGLITEEEYQKKKQELLKL